MENPSLAVEEAPWLTLSYTSHVYIATIGSMPDISGIRIHSNGMHLVKTDAVEFRLTMKELYIVLLTHYAHVGERVLGKASKVKYVGDSAYRIMSDIWMEHVDKAKAITLWARDTHKEMGGLLLEAAEVLASAHKYRDEGSLIRQAKLHAVILNPSEVAILFITWHDGMRVKIGVYVDTTLSKVSLVVFSSNNGASKSKVYLAESISPIIRPCIQSMLAVTNKSKERMEMLETWNPFVKLLLWLPNDTLRQFVSQVGEEHRKLLNQYFPIVETSNEGEINA
jgi:hypothetical protein